MPLVPTPFDAVHIGARVVVRYRLDPDREGSGAGPSMTDVTGELVARGDTEVVVAGRHGHVTVRRDRIVAAKEIPPRPSRRGAAHLALSVADLQRVMSPSWGAIEREHLGDWELRASQGFTQRANSVLPIGDPGVPLTEAVDRVERWYAVRGLPARVSLAGPVGFEPAEDPLGAELLARGWTSGDRTLNLTAPTEVIAAADPGGPDVLVTRELDESWLGAYRLSREVEPEAAPQVLAGSPVTLFGSISLGGGLAQKLGLTTPGSRAPRPVAIGRVGLARGWAGLGALWTDPAFRRRGLGTRLTTQLASVARAEGIHLMHLQVEADNAAGIALYEGLGFARHSSYVYLTAARP